jgi:hypothetical protein
MQMFGPVFFAQAGEPGAKRDVGLRSFEERIHQSAQIKSSAAHKYCHMTAGFHFLNRLGREARVVASGKVLNRLDDIYQVMGHPLTFRVRDLGGRDLDAPVDLNRIQIYDLAVARQSQPDAQVALTGGGRTYDYRNHLPCA